MAVLRVSQFACIDDAELEIGPLTVLIGPQASGKSVISKLTLFFYDIVSRQFFSIQPEFSYKQFCAEVVDQFKIWFPPSAWGRRKFKIEFQVGALELRFTRTSASNRPAMNVKFKASDNFEEAFVAFSAALKESVSSKANEEGAAFATFDRDYTIEAKARREIKQLLGSDAYDSHIFVPAGRSFFTSVGKAVTAFEQGGLFDPVTIRFGRLFASLRENRILFQRASEEFKQQAQKHKEIMHAFLKGDIKKEQGNDVIATNDGRTIAFSLLSSGQQELLPLLMVLEFVSTTRSGRPLVYIEEPEAHLFPKAQGQIVEYLANLVSQGIATNSPHDSRRSLFLTTHSPYVLSKINVLLKAGDVGLRSKRNAQKVSEVIPQDYWLRKEDVRAYALIDGRATSILDETGIIDAEYLDQFSNELSGEYSEILAIEYEK